MPDEGEEGNTAYTGKLGKKGQVRAAECVAVFFPDLRTSSLVPLALSIIPITLVFFSNTLSESVKTIFHGTNTCQLQDFEDQLYKSVMTCKYA